MVKFIVSTILLLVTTTMASADAIDAAIANVNRPETDTALDARRKPGEVLRFFEIKAGQSILDIFAGGGYYSELMSYVVGPKGSVTLYNNIPLDTFVQKAVETRLGGDRLPNVNRVITSPESLGQQTGGYDAAIFILRMHDIYYADPEDGWSSIDKHKFLMGIYNLLNDGAVLGVVDHNAVADAEPAKTGKDLHRVDPNVLIKDLEAAGFRLEASSDVLRNKDDDLSTSVFLPENRWRTDRSVLRFRKFSG